MWLTIDRIHFDFLILREVPRAGPLSDSCKTSWRNKYQERDQKKFMWIFLPKMQDYVWKYCVFIETFGYFHLMIGHLYLENKNKIAANSFKDIENSTCKNKCFEYKLGTT